MKHNAHAHYTMCMQITSIIHTTQGLSGEILYIYNKKIQGLIKELCLFGDANSIYHKPTSIEW